MNPEGYSWKPQQRRVKTGMAVKFIADTNTGDSLFLFYAGDDSLTFPQLGRGCPLRCTQSGTPPPDTDKSFPVPHRGAARATWSAARGRGPRACTDRTATTLLPCPLRGDRGRCSGRGASVRSGWSERQPPVGLPRRRRKWRRRGAAGGAAGRR